ncbi:MAG: hypothetical protein C4516_08270 [Oxalobacter sp.]|nr:MAG: hypothetical protein C4516_08270 [Oxalobacter sp.]
MNPFQSALKWLLRIALSFLVVTALLSAWFMIQEEYRVYGSTYLELMRLKNAKRISEESREAQEKSLAQWFESLQEATADQLSAHIEKFENDIRSLESGQPSSYDKSVALLKGDLDPLKKELDLLIRKKTLAHLRQLHETVVNRQSRESAIIKLESLRLEHAAAYETLMRKEKEWQAFRSENCHEILGVKLEEPRVMPFSSEWRRLNELEAEYRVLFQANQGAYDKYRQQEAFLKRIGATTAARFVIPPEYADHVLGSMDEKIAGLELTLQKSWASHFAGPVSAAIPVALGIIFLTLMTPLMIKTFLYFVLAPLVSRRRAVCLMPGASGSLHGSHGIHSTDGRARSISAVSQEIAIDADQELLVHSEYLQSTSVSGKKDTKFLLDWSIPLTSLLAGLVTLTRIRGASHASCVISSTKDPLSEVGVIEIPEGAAVVIQPRYLVGIVKRVDAPISITRRWQLKSLNAWLTLQIRYFIFHGPTKLIVKGCRGIRVERAAAGRGINQAAMIGFSANLMYAPRRCDTFVPYLRGKQELFNDHFSGEDGHFIYEEMPNEGKKSTLLFGRGLEGLLDTFMRIFGI